MFEEKNEAYFFIFRKPNVCALCSIRRNKAGLCFQTVFSVGKMQLFRPESSVRYVNRVK